MNRIFKAIVMLSVVALFSAACTKQESINIKYQNNRDKYPELYKLYLQQLREYRSSEHQVTIARFDNKATSAISRADHLNALPDSIDYVVLNNPFGISEAADAEIAALAADKGQKFLTAISYEQILKDYKAYVEALEEKAEEGEEITPKTPAEFIGECVNQFLDIFTRHPLDGMLVSYIGKNPLSMGQDEAAANKELQEAYFAPILQRIASTGKMLFFEGNTKNIVIDGDILGVAKYIIVPAESETTITSLNYAVNKMMGEGIPTDRFIIGVTALDVASETATDGLFSGYSSASVGAACWAVEPAAYTKCGICVNHAQNDYFHLGNDFCEIKAAISTMNPSPLK